MREIKNHAKAFGLNYFKDGLAILVGYGRSIRGADLSEIIWSSILNMSEMPIRYLSDNVR